MEYFIKFISRPGTKRFAILILMVGFLYLIRSLLDLLLLTFIFTYLMYSMQNFLIMRLRNVVRVKQKIMIMFLYATLAVLIVFGIYKFVPDMIRESTAVMKQVKIFYKQPHDNPVINYLIDASKKIDFAGYADQGVNFVFKAGTQLSKWGLNILISLILSLFFLLERNRISRFTSRFRTSKISAIYNEIAYFSSKFIHSFGKVIEAQILIALINSVLSFIALWAMGFTQALGLGIMIFFLGLIPVAGVLISLIPLCMIAFSIGGITKVVYVLIMIAVLHALESYVLNPKLMSQKTELPVFYTFIILIVSEHFLGVWGLIIGIPIFMFILDVLEINKESDKKQELE